MLIGYARVSKTDGSQVLDLQIDALKAFGVLEENIYSDYASGKIDERPNLQACLKVLRKGDVLVVWKLDRLGRNLKHLINIVHDLEQRKIGLKVLSGQGADIDTTTANGRLIFSIFAILAEYEREMISERTKAGITAARARGRKGGRKFKMNTSKLSIVQGAMQSSGTNVTELCKELGISRQTLYRYVDSRGKPRSAVEKLLTKNNTNNI